jgi:hypothetical protein
VRSHHTQVFNYFLTGTSGNWNPTALARSTAMVDVVVEETASSAFGKGSIAVAEGHATSFGHGHALPPLCSSPFPPVTSILKQQLRPKGNCAFRLPMVSMKIQDFALSSSASGIWRVARVSGLNSVSWSQPFVDLLRPSPVSL